MKTINCFQITIKKKKMEQSSKGLAIASLVLGIIGILTTFVCMCFMPFIAPFLGIPGLILGIIGIRKKEGGMANCKYNTIKYYINLKPYFLNVLGLCIS